MSEILKSWVLGLCAVSLLSAAAQAAVGKGKYADLLRLIAALSAAIVIAAPVRAGRAALAREIGDVQTFFSLSRAPDSAKAQADALTARQIEAYIAALGEELGAECTAKAECESDDGVFYLRALRVHFEEGTKTPDKARALAAFAQALGVDKTLLTEG
ncbi:MAG: hypothetical protein II727_08895 [Oscillospiraceae bacterium]|nr:hypothetical protein [Oscillospiraceae bacterium]